MKRSAKEKEEALADVKHADALLHLATEPADVPHQETLDEVRALRHFEKMKCTRAPHRLSYSEDYTLKGVDELAMRGGYTVFMLMNKIPGEALSYDAYWKKDEKVREEVRGAFTKALM
jgi:hypothetical protein